MHTLAAVDIKREPTLLLDNPQRGQVTVVTGQFPALPMTLPLDHGAPAAGALLDLAVSRYDNEQISLGRAAETAGLAFADMMDELGRRGIATIRLQPGELERELAAFGP